ncbi:hypothetical protein J4410_01700, partial [Candidatus Woesearchaeota archaeon]|nr:hypothetical protein [Candidatus Woesearchaeota archaeon]
MQIVVDANPLISMIIKPGVTADLLFLEELDLVMPSLLFYEIKKHKSDIAKKSVLTEQEIDNFIKIIEERIRFIPAEEFLKYRKEAIKLSPDEKDITYFALALYLKCPIWSNE